MSEDLIQLFPLITWPVVTAFAIWKIGVPLINWFILKKGGGNNEIAKKMKNLENNHLGEIRRDMREVKQDIKKLEENQGLIRERLVKVETKAFNNKTL